MVTTSATDGFIPYIISSSFYKAHRRITHWSSNGHLVTMGMLVGPEMNRNFNQYYQAFLVSGRSPRTERRDSNLREFLLGLEEASGTSDGSSFIPDDIPLTGFVWPGVTGQRTFPALSDAMRRLSEDESLVTYDVYNGLVAAEFHLLLLSTVSALRWALINYRQKLASQSSTRSQDCISAGRNVKLYGTMLWNITYSQLLEYHLHLLEHSSPLTFPKFYCRDEYMHIIGQCAAGVAPPGVGTANNAEASEDASSQASEGASGEASGEASEGASGEVSQEASGETSEGEASEGASGEHGLLPNDGDDAGEAHRNASVLHSWFRLLVAHFAGVGSLSEWARTHNEPIDDCITLLRVPKPESQGDMKCWKAIINTPGVSGDPKGDIQLLTSLIKDKTLSVAKHLLVQKFREGMVDDNVTKVPFVGNRHCETEITSLPCLCCRRDVEVTGMTLEEIETIIQSADFKVGK